MKIDAPPHISPHFLGKKGKVKSKKSSTTLQELHKPGFSDSACPSTPITIRNTKSKSNKSSDANKIQRQNLYNQSKIITKASNKKKIDKKDSKLQEFDHKSKTLPKTDRARHNFDVVKKKRWKILNCKTQNDNKQQIEKSSCENKNKDFAELKLKSDRGSRKLKKKKGIQVLSICKNRNKKVNKSEEAIRLIKSAETSYGEILERYYKLRKFQDFSRDGFGKAKDNFMSIGKKLSKKIKLKKKRKYKSTWTESDKLTPINKKKTKVKSSDDNPEPYIENKENLQEKMRKLKQRVMQTKSTLLSKAHTPSDNIDQILKIQRWFRSKIRQKPKISLSLSDKNQLESFSNILTPAKLIRSNSDLVQPLESKIFISVEPEVKQLKDSNSIKSFNQNSSSETELKLENNENQPKKVQKVPSLCLSTILQSKNISEDYKFEKSDSSLDSSLSYEYVSSGSEESSVESIKQISSLDIERRSDSSQSSIVSRKSFESFSSDEDISEQDRGNWMAKYVENEYMSKSIDQDEVKEALAKENHLEEVKELNQYSDQENPISKENEKYLKQSQETNLNHNNLQKTEKFSDYHNPSPLIQEFFENPTSAATSYQSSLNNIQHVPDQKPKEVSECHPVESPRLISDTSYPDLSNDDSCTSELSNLIDPDLCLRHILQSSSASVKDLIERPENRMMRDSDSSEEEFNPPFLYTDTNISEAQLQSFSNPILELQEHDQDVLYIINNEVQDFIQSCEFKLDLIHIDTSLAFIEKYVKSLQSKLEENEEEILELINTPAYQDPIRKLEYLQSKSLGNMLKFSGLELILPQDLSSELKVEYEALEMPSRQIYLQMIFDCVNEALNYIRPFDVCGLPHPWSLVSATLYGEGEVRAVAGKVMKFIRKWESVRCGMLDSRIHGHTLEKVSKNREERLNVIIAQNVRDSEGYWMDYEDEETQVKIEISKLALDELIEETANLL